MRAPTPTTRPLTLAAAALAAAALLAGCTPAADPEPSASPTPSQTPTETSTPEPEPARPPLADLVLTTEGLPGLAIGSSPSADPATALATYDPAGCDGFGLWTTDPDYATQTDFGPPVAFGIGGDGAVDRIELYSDVIPTDAGIRLGISTRADVEAAYPDAGVSPAQLTDLYIVGGTTGALIIEVTARDADYWGSSGIALDTVQYIRAVPSGIEAYSIAASGNVVGVCGS